MDLNLQSRRPNSSSGSAQLGDLLIEVLQRRFQCLLVIGMRRVGQIVHDSRTRKLQLIHFLISRLLLRSLGPATSCGLFAFAHLNLGCHLLLNVLAFPSSRHGS